MYVDHGRENDEKHWLLNQVAIHAVQHKGVSAASIQVPLARRTWCCVSAGRLCIGYGC